MAKVVPRRKETWPALPLEQWKETYATLHMWTQIVGKIRLALAPLINHWWNVPLYVDARGLTTSAIPYGATPFDLSFDFIDHQFLLNTSDGTQSGLRQQARQRHQRFQKQSRLKAVKQFPGERMSALQTVKLADIPPTRK